MSESDTPLQVNKKVIKTRLLIDMVRQRPCLWDRLSPDYRDRDIKEHAWTEIYQELDPNYEALNEERKNQIGLYITRKWYNIRDSYVKSRKSHRSRNRPYLYAEAMNFLDSTSINSNKKSRKNSSKAFRGERMSHDEEENEVIEPVIWMDDLYEDADNNVDTSELPADAINMENNNLAKENGDDNYSIVQVLATLIQKEEDEDRSFFKSITPSVKKLSEHSKFEFRIQVMKLLHSLQTRDRTQKVTLKRERMSNMDSESE